jgi:hypothetical protein
MTDNWTVKTAIAIALAIGGTTEEQKPVPRPKFTPNCQCTAYCVCECCCVKGAAARQSNKCCCKVTRGTPIKISPTLPQQRLLGPVHGPIQQPIRIVPMRGPVIRSSGHCAT